MFNETKIYQHTFTRSYYYLYRLANPLQCFRFVITYILFNQILLCKRICVNDDGSIKLLFILKSSNLVVFISKIIRYKLSICEELLYADIVRLNSYCEISNIQYIQTYYILVVYLINKNTI